MRPILALCSLVLAPLSVIHPTFAQEPLESDSPSRLQFTDAGTAMQIEAEVIDLVKQLWAAISSRDSTAVVQLIHPQALFVTVGVRKDREQLMADFAPWNSPDNAADDSAAESDFGFDLSDFRVLVLSESAAIVNYVLAWDQVSPLFPSRLFDSHVWVKRDGTWKIVFAHDSVVELVEFLRSALQES